MSRRSDKAVAEKLHCLGRLRKRFGRGQETYDRVLELIQGGKAEHIYKQSCTRSIFKVDDMFVVYSKLNKTLITVMTKEMMK